MGSLFLRDWGSVEIGNSGCCCPPGQTRPGQHTSSCTQWYRVDSGEWVRLRSWTKLKKAVDCAASREEFLKMLNA